MPADIIMISFLYAAQHEPMRNPALGGTAHSLIVGNKMKNANKN